MKYDVQSDLYVWNETEIARFCEIYYITKSYAAEIREIKGTCYSTLCDVQCT